MRYRILFTTFLAILIAIGLAACSEESSSTQARWYSQNTLYRYDRVQGNLWDHMRRDMRMPNYSYMPQVRQQIVWFQHHQDYLNHVIAESAPYIYYIYQQTQTRRLPAELALIPVIESEYNPYARSRRGAMGLWQMMPGTARGFGLKRDWWYDGRKDIVASTNAALNYFAYLHSYFNNNWLLAIAAYDWGEGNIAAAVRYNQLHHRSGDFWNLPMPNETRNYVPRLLAVAAIVKAPHHYGIDLAPINDAPYIAQIKIDKPIALSKAANLAQVPLSTMKVLNPAIQHDKTDPHGPYTILVPQDKADSFREKLASLTQQEKAKLAQVKQKYKTDIALLRASGEPASSKPAVTIPTPVRSSKENVTASHHHVHTAEAEPTHLYVVRRGDYIGKIARKFRVSEENLKQWNQLSNNNLQPGQKLIIRKKA